MRIGLDIFIRPSQPPPSCYLILNNAEIYQRLGLIISGRQKATPCDHIRTSYYNNYRGMQCCLQVWPESS